MKKILCLVLSVVFILSCLSVYGFAEDSDGSTNTESSVCITEMSPVDPSSKEIKLAAYQSRPIIISVLPTDAKDLVSWSVADKTIARVSADGVVTGKKAGKTTVTVAAADGSRKKITYKVTVTARQPGNNLSTESCTVVNTQKSKYTYDQMCKDLKILKQTYPYLLDYVSLGKTYDNREIYEIVIGNKDSKNKIFVQSTIHAREYINSMLVMEQVEALCANYYSGSYRGKYYSELLENCCFYIVPMSNPDGVAISTKGADGIRDNTLRSKVIKMYKKYGEGKSSYYTKWKANARGVDLNRNWDCNWKSKKTVTYACSEGYKGSSPVSEKETKILKNEVETLKPKAIQTALLYIGILFRRVHFKESVRICLRSQKGLRVTLRLKTRALTAALRQISALASEIGLQIL